MIKNKKDVPTITRPKLTSVEDTCETWEVREAGTEKLLGKYYYIPTKQLVLAKLLLLAGLLVAGIIYIGA